VGEGTDELPFAGSPSQEALFQARAWDAHEATRDPLTRDLLGPYLARHRVASMLDAPVRLAGRLAGILRHERVGEPARPFTADDARLAEALADLVALALEAWQRQEAEERLAQASLHDPLTDLPNRRLFLERVDRSLRGLDRRGGGLLAVLSVDVDDPAGTKAGRERDERLLAVAKAITGVLRPADTPARLEGDGFGVLIDRLDEPWEAIAVAERVLSALGRPVAAPGGPLLPAASVGIALADGSHPTSAEGLLHDANLARARARNQGGWRYEVFDTTLRRDVLDRMSLGWALRDALPAGQLVLEYQPERSLHTRRLLELEALLRWDRPGHGRLPAGAFLDLAESSGLIVPIGSWVLREACRRVQGWRRDPRAAHLGVRVNLSARQFERPDLPETVAAALEESGLRAEALCLEITETVLMGNAPAALGILTALKALGVRLAIDDFGTGYSSLAYLKRFPVDTLKIDRSFVEGLGTDPIDLPIVKAVMSLGQTLGLEVVAEGVDRPLQEQTLRALGCDRVQGFLFGRALPPEEVPSLFAVP
jgi:Amt family ammonium transporter